MKILLTFVLSVATVSQVLAWGEQGHRGIAESVQAHLEPETAKAIAKIVGTGNELPLGTVARLFLWPDQIRALTKNPHAVITGFTPEEMEEARTFITNQPDNTNWHFVDLPLGADHYPNLQQPDPTDPVLPFVTATDVVR